MADSVGGGKQGGGDDRSNLTPRRREGRRGASNWEKGRRGKVVGMWERVGGRKRAE